MPRNPRNVKTFYIDTNVALDYITARNREAILVLDKIREKGWKCISSSFLAMELADYKKDSLFVIDKAIEKKWEMRRILRETYNKDLKRGDFEKIFEWFNNFVSQYKNIVLYDFLNTSDDWQWAQEISFNSNLNAPDAIHLTSAFQGAVGGLCRFMITNDKHFKEEADRLIIEYKLQSKLNVITVSETKKTFFKSA
jgi:predicted nucleic acid-binding protein